MKKEMIAVILVIASVVFFVGCYSNQTVDKSTMLE